MYQQHEQQPYYQQGYQQNPQTLKKMHKHCRKFLQQYVTVMLSDGSSYNGFIEFTDGQNLYFAAPIVQEGQNSEQEYRNEDYEFPYYGFVQPVNTYEIERFILPLTMVANVSPIGGGQSTY
ncbi:hypothetical protein A374_14650 [Fictibacillus macauensis ZFHKF-1]|uniref:Uncharacterized protein n=1 Tax=Fictibacillus macauensis ZFHKF-1 TaxID=1196324 RepID=I8IYM6_9BACL|nr:hypothetical protein [Fictibacillus macauensis]EIT84576.1 hypothetical protein A374_14650 [Fictibacillus macauensis ZFHKF-1]